MPSLFCSLPEPMCLVLSSARLPDLYGSHPRLCMPLDFLLSLINKQSWQRTEV